MGSRPALVSLLLLLVAAPAARAGAGPPAFDGERAKSLLGELCALGPRVPGTKPHAAARAFLVERLRASGAAVELEEFPAASPPYGKGIMLTNVAARFAPGRTPRILLGAHWDSRPRADADPDSTRHDEPVLGANDAAASCAVLLHLAELFAARPPAVGVDLVLFDGEDGGLAASPDTYCLGSREHARRLGARRPAYVLVLDMIGDRELTVHAEGYSMAYAPDLVRAVWGRAERLGLTEFVLEPRHQVFDDHMPFLEAGIPAADLIDFDYPHWHTTADTPDKCSARSLGVVGELVASLCYEP